MARGPYTMGLALAAARKLRAAGIMVAPHGTVEEG